MNSIEISFSHLFAEMNSVDISDPPWPAKPLPSLFLFLQSTGGGRFRGVVASRSDMSGVEEVVFSLLCWGVLLASKQFRE